MRIVTRRHIKLPSILNLPTSPYDDILTSAGYVSKVILSCSPDEDEDNCRVLVLRDCGNPLAFCCPGRSKEWTLMLDEQRGKRYYKDCVYSNRLKLFFALTYSHNETRFETWDLGDLSSPKLIKVDICNYLTSVERFLRYKCEPIEHLVVADEDLFLVTQYMIFNVGLDGLCFDHLDERCPDNSRHMTIRFDILKYDSEKGKFEYVDSSSLGGLAIFVGVLSHPVAIQATDQFPELKPDSIYFTDGFGMGPLSGDYSHYDEHELRGHDIGIYNYRDKTVSSCYYPCDAPSMKTITPPPIWFFPSPTI
ncbi:hypothetical protein CASFOL_026544 [Castilleja foliolosa]|uniref:KIB1-4 beta-propeller domain-containing protein n=1 Tax=Castilleja foliolosa TaxID=1961234 RepID=A0ABD3CIB7_9LAMI